MVNKILLVASFAVFFLFNIAYAAYDKNTEIGKIMDISYYPEKPMVSKPAIISFAAANTGDARQTFKIKIFIIKNGNIMSQTESLMSIYPGEKKGNTSEFYPRDIGSYEILAKLYDKYETKLLDMISLKMDVGSELGPFDLTVSPLARRVQQSEELPVLLTFINKGITGTDVSIRVEIKCPTYSITNEFMMFASPEKQIEKLVTMPTCNVNGMHNIESTLRISNQIYAISTAQFYINDTTVAMELSLPGELLLEQGGTKLFDISVRNIAPYALHNIKLFSEGFPKDWIAIQPASVSELKQNETAIFLVSFSLPKDADARVYSAKFIVSSDEMSNRKASVLKVMEAEVIPIEAEETRNFFQDNYLYILAGLFAAVLIAIKLKRKRRYNSLAVLKTIINRRNDA